MGDNRGGDRHHLQSLSVRLPLGMLAALDRQRGPLNRHAFMVRLTAAGLGPITPPFRGPMAPVHPCREMPTRHCPAVLDAVCGTRPCARFHSDDIVPWLPELEHERVLTKLDMGAGWRIHR